MARLVRFRVQGGIAVVTLDAPPVNALSVALRAGLWEVFGRISQNDDIRAAVMFGSGDLFSAGDDIRELGAAGRPSLAQLCDLIENCSKPVVAAVQGQALGGGAALLLAAHYRLAAPDARIALPEVGLGLVPNAGATQRLPRLIGAERALQMMVSSQSIDAGSAQRAGLVDAIVQGEFASAAVAFAQDLLTQNKGPRRTRDNRNFLADGRAYQAALARTRDMLAGTPLHAPHRVVDCVEAAALLPFDAGLAFEADAFAQCLGHPQSHAMCHVFMAERKIDKALIAREGSSFLPVDPMGKACVQRLRRAMRAAADVLVAQGAAEAEVDGALVAFGFRKGPYGSKETGAADENIARRIVAALVVEGLDCVDTQAVQRAADIDALAVHGLGFPRRMGGPLRAAQTMGLIALRRDMRVWAQQNAIWTVPALLDEAIKDARGFDALA